MSAAPPHGAGGPLAARFAALPARDLAAPAARDARAELRRLAQELEGVFLNQLFQAMRASVPQDGLITKSQGEEMFTSMLDQSLAQEAARRLDRGLSEALYRQLVRRLDGGASGPR